MENNGDSKIIFKAEITKDGNINIETAKNENAQTEGLICYAMYLLKLQIDKMIINRQIRASDTVIIPAVDNVLKRLRGKYGRG